VPKQTSLRAFEPDLSVLTEAEREAYRAVRIDGTGPRPFARETDRSPGTVGNLLARAEDKLGEGSA